MVTAAIATNAERVLLQLTSPHKVLGLQWLADLCHQFVIQHMVPALDEQLDGALHGLRRVSDDRRCGGQQWDDSD